MKSGIPLDFNYLRHPTFHIGRKDEGHQRLASAPCQSVTVLRSGSLASVARYPGPCPEVKIR